MPEANIGRGGAGSAKSLRAVRARQPRVIRPPRVVVAAPRGDIASSGGDYGMKQARRAERSAPVKRAQRAAYKAAPVAQRQRILKHAQGSVKSNVAPVHAGRQRYQRQLDKSAAGKDTKGNTDRARAQAFLTAHPEILRRTDGKKGSHLATITGGIHLGQIAGKALSSVPKLLSNLGALHLATAGRSGHGGGSASDTAGQFGLNAAKDTKDLVTGTPTSLAKLATTAYHNPKKVPGMLADPYVQLYHHPGKFAFEHPVSTFLMLDPAIKVPGRIGGRVARTAGKQTLKRADATLPGTAMKAERIGSRDVTVRAVQTARDNKAAKAGKKPTISHKELQTRVDEFYDRSRRRAQDAHRQTYQEHMAASKGTAPRKARRVAAREAADAARQAQHDVTRTEFAREFGANERPTIGAAQTAAAVERHVTAKAQVKVAKKQLAKAKEQHAQVLANARVAVARTRRSPTLANLERQRIRAQREVVRRKQAAEAEYAHAVEAAKKAKGSGPKTIALAKLERDHRRAMSELRAAKNAHADAIKAAGEAKGRAQVLSRNVGGSVAERRAGAVKVSGDAPQYAAGGHGVQVAAETLQKHADAVAQAQARVSTLERSMRAEKGRRAGIPPAEADALARALERRTAHHPEQIRAARQAVADLNEQVVAERGRIAGVPPAEHDALTRAIAAHDMGKADLKAAYAERRAADVGRVATKAQAKAAPLTKAKEHGRIFEHRDDANRVRRALEGTLDAKRMKTADGYAVVPRVAHERLVKHEKVGSSPAFGAKLFRMSSRSFRGTVLPTSGKWLAGQAVEAGVRATLKGAGPTSWLRAQRVVKAMNKNEAGSGDAMLQRALPGGQFDPGAVVRSGLDSKKTWADEFPESKTAAGLSKSAALPVVRHVRHGWHGYSRFVMDTVNGVIETNTQKAMLGKAIAEHPVMERRILTLSDKAINEAAQGLKGTHSQLSLGRDVLRAYGKYSKFSPKMRENLAHLTPFLPWYINMVKFLTQVLPVDHPIHAALLASNDVATQDWRKAHHLSYYSNKIAPSFLQGTYPIGGDKYRNVGRYMPFAPGSLSEPLGAAFLPQFSGPLLALAPGVDWKGQAITPKDPRNEDPLHVREAILGAVESHIPGAQLAGRATGIGPWLHGDAKKVKAAGQQSIPKNLLDAINPAHPIQGHADKPKGKKSTRKKANTSGLGGLRGGSSGGGLAGLKG